MDGLQKAGGLGGANRLLLPIRSAPPSFAANKHVDDTMLSLLQMRRIRQKPPVKRSLASRLKRPKGNSGAAGGKKKASQHF